MSQDDLKLQVAQAALKYAQEGVQKSAMITRCSREGASAEAGSSAQRMN